MTERPSLAELRARVHKGRHREIGNWLARRVARPTAVYGTWLAVRCGLTANQVTLAAVVISGASAVLIGSGTRGAFVAGVLLAFVAFWLDRVDGQVARWRGTASLDGVYLDYMMHHAANLALGFGLGHGLAVRSRDPCWSVAGFAIAAGWAALALHNDCRYKAMFQRLKIATATYRVDGGRGGRPAPPAPWPRRGVPALTWPAYKMCEPHVVLLALAVLAALAVVAPENWVIVWKWGVIAMACLAPTLAAARVGRAIVRQSVEADFRRWFDPWTPPPTNPGSPMPPPGHEKRRSYDGDVFVELTARWCTGPVSSAE
jgi:hypothetical protein